MGNVLRNDSDLFGPGGSGNDHLFADRGSDYLDGGEGKDTLVRGETLGYAQFVGRPTESRRWRDGEKCASANERFAERRAA